MFICENPSLAGVRQGAVQTIDGGPADIESQWWGGPRNPAARRFRVALCELGLKDGAPSSRGGWNCYITNVVKEANIAGDQEAKSPAEKRQQARDWAAVLQWELGRVRPKHVFTVGGRAHAAVRGLQSESLLPKFEPYQVRHYSARMSDQAIIDDIVTKVRAARR